MLSREQVRSRGGLGVQAPGYGEGPGRPSGLGAACSLSACSAKNDGGRTMHPLFILLRGPFPSALRQLISYWSAQTDKNGSLFGHFLCTFRNRLFSRVRQGVFPCTDRDGTGVKRCAHIFPLRCCFQNSKIPTPSSRTFSKRKMT